MNSQCEVVQKPLILVLHTIVLVQIEFLVDLVEDLQWLLLQICVWLHWELIQGEAFVNLQLFVV